MSEIIGGEFAIDPDMVNIENCFKPKTDEYLYSSGRSAFYHILLNIKANCPIIDTVLLPDYLCGSIIEAVKKAKFKYIFYAINESFFPETEKLISLITENKCLLLINYFGLLDIETTIENIKNVNPEICIILDNVQALFEMQKITKANYSFTSLRKWLPVPDGAMVKTAEKGMVLPAKTNTFCQLKFASGLLKKYRTFPEIEDKLYLDFSVKGEKLLEIHYNCKCSRITLSILSYLNFTEIISKRRKNALFLFDNIKGIDNFLTIKDREMYSKAVSMFFPVYLNNRDVIREKLVNENIFCPIHWPPPTFTFKNTIYEKELSLVIDQRYSTNDMQRIVEILDKCKAL